MSRKKFAISDINTNSIGGRIRYLRVYLGLSGKSFAKKLGINQSNLSEIENSKYEPSFKVLNKITEVFNINANWLLTGKGPIYQGEEDQKIQVLKTEIEGLLKEKALIEEKIDAINKALEELDIEKRAILLDSILNLLKLNSP